MEPYIIKKINVSVFSHKADSVIKIPPWAWMGIGEKGKTHTRQLVSVRVETKLRR